MTQHYTASRLISTGISDVIKYVGEVAYLIQGNKFVPAPKHLEMKTRTIITSAGEMWDKENEITEERRKLNNEKLHNLQASQSNNKANK